MTAATTQAARNARGSLTEGRSTEELKDLVFQVGAELELAPAENIIEWAVATFGERFCVTSSMGDAVLAHLEQGARAMLFASGIALALSAGNVYFRDLSYLWQIFSQVWFFATPIVYMPSLIEGKVPEWVERVLDFNPMAVFAQGFRRSMYDNAFPGWDNLGACALVALVSMTAGWSIFTRLSRRFAEEL